MSFYSLLTLLSRCLGPGRTDNDKRDWQYILQDLTEFSVQGFPQRAAQLSLTGEAFILSAIKRKMQNKSCSDLTETVQTHAHHISGRRNEEDDDALL